MENTDSHKQFDSQLKIFFPKSSEDHRLQIVGINDVVFAIFHSPLESDGPINLYCEDWSLVLLAPIKSKKDVVISGINVICLNEIESAEGNVNIQASQRLVKLTTQIKAFQKINEISMHPSFQLQDSIALLNYFQLFTKVVQCAHEATPDSFMKAQQNFITALSLLTETIGEKTSSIDIQPILKIWGIPNQPKS